MQENTCAVNAGPLERLGRPEIPKEIACAECRKCGYARTGDFCFFSDGTCYGCKVGRCSCHLCAGGALVELTYTLSEKEVAPENKPLVVTLDKPDGKDVNAYIITVDAENKNYDITTVPGIYSITPAPLVITVKDAEREHGAENPKFDVIYDGFKNSEDSTVLEGDLTFTTDATPGSDGGKYTVNVDGLKGKNYTITFVSGTLTVQNPPAQPAPEPAPTPTPVPEKPKKPVSGNTTTGNDFFEIYPLAAPLAGLLDASTAAGAWILGKKRKKTKPETAEDKTE